jgi:glycosyltransferase involved in cell wall biosynthesis
MSQPAVSVLVTTFRHARFVEESLDSLAAQTCPDFETIITDDASDDGTAEIIDRWLSRTGFPARFICKPVNRGICANRNAALALARGRFVCSLSGDDAYHPERIERQLASFAVEPGETACVYSDAMLVDAESRPLGVTYLQDKLRMKPPPDGDIFRKLLLDDIFLPSPAVMVRRAALDAVGLYDESLYFEDLYMWLKLSHRFRFHYAPGSLVRYRVLPESMSRSPSTRAAMAESTFRVLNTWIGKCGDAEDALRERLWYLAMRRIAAGDHATAQRMMSRIAIAGGKWRRRAAARLTFMPGGCGLVRGLARAYNGFHRIASAS